MAARKLAEGKAGDAEGLRPGWDSFRKPQLFRHGIVASKQKPISVFSELNDENYMAFQAEGRSG